MGDLRVTLGFCKHDHTRTLDANFENSEYPEEILDNILQKSNGQIIDP